MRIYLLSEAQKNHDKPNSFCKLLVVNISNKSQKKIKKLANDNSDLTSCKTQLSAA